MLLYKLLSSDTALLRFFLASNLFMDVLKITHFRIDAEFYRNVKSSHFMHWHVLV